MPRPKTEITGQPTRVGIRLTLLQRDEYRRLGGPAWLRKLLNLNIVKRQKRKQRAEETNKAYINRGSWGKVADPYDDITQTFKALIAVIAVTTALTLLAFILWGK